MTTHQQMLDEAISAAPAMAERDCLAKRGNTCTVVTWHLGRAPIERKGNKHVSPLQQHGRLTGGLAGGERKAVLDAREAAELSVELRERFRSTDGEREESQRQWRDWLASRSDEGGAPDFVSGWREAVPAVTPVVGEARFSTVLRARHDKCVLCDAIEITKADRALAGEEMRQRLWRLKHSIPRLLYSPPPIGVIALGAQNEATFDHLVSASAWGHQETLSTATPGELLGDMSLVADDIDNVLASKDYPLSSSITRLLASCADDTDIINNLLNNKAIMRHHGTVLRRIKVYRANRDAEEARLIAAGCHKRLSIEEIRTASKAKADVLELKRDLAMLETTQTACEANLTLVRACPDVLDVSKRLAENRRFATTSGFFHRQQGGRDPYNLHGRRYTDEEGEDGMQLDSQQRPTLPTPLQAGQETAMANESPTNIFRCESPEQYTDNPGPLTTTLQDSSRRTWEQEDNASVSTDGDPFSLERALDVVPTTQGTAVSISGEAIAPSYKGKEKKDSKVEGFLDDDGVSLKDFAVVPDQKKGKPFRTLSVEAGSSSRPPWR